jgi:flavodoxin I
MSQIGIFFGTDTGTTRLIAKKMAKQLPEGIASKPLNVNRIEAADLLNYDALILGTPSYGEGQVPGISTGVKQGSWEEFLPQLAGLDFTGKRIALYGLGNQDKYGSRFASGLFQLYEAFKSAGADIVGSWPTDGYEFEYSRAVVDGRFVGLVIDQNSQGMQTEERMKTWLDQVVPQLLGENQAAAAVG